MEEEMLKKFEQAGKIAGQALKYGSGLVKSDAKLLDVADAIEQKIRESGGEPAFPVNLSLNEFAAHDTAGPNDERVFGESVVKLDVGVHVDGCVGGDTAMTIDLTGKYKDLVAASRDALNAAIKIVQIGTTLGSIGAEISQAIESHGLKPVRNLSGHGLGVNTVHTSPSVPNYDNKDETELSDGMTIAIEPFATNGVGLITDKGQPLIHSLVLKKPVRNIITRNVLKEIKIFNGLPFATRWLTNKFPVFKVNYAMKEMDQLKMLHSYAPLVEREKGIVSQAEHSFFIGDKVKILTKL